MMSARKLKSKDLKRLLRYLTHYRGYIVLVLLCGAVAGIGTVAATYYTGVGIDTLLGAGEVRFSELYRVLILLGITFFSSILAQWLINVFANQVSFQAVKDLRIETFAKLNQLPLSFFDNMAHGNVISRFTNDLESLSEALTLALNNLFSGGVIVLSALGFMLYLSPTLTFIVLGTTPLVFLIGWIVARLSQKNFTQQQRILGELSGYVSEVVNNQKVVKAFHHEQAVEEQFQEINSRLYTWGQKAQFTSSITNPAARFVDHLTYLLIGMIGGLLVINGTGNVTVGTVSSFVIYSAQFSKPFIEISGIMTQIQTASAGLKRIFEVLDTDPEIPDAENAEILEGPAGAVHFEDVSFSYNPEVPLIEHLNMTVQPGETIAIVGQTGAGKSTLINLLMRFYELNEGKISVDGQNVTAYTRDSLRQSFGMVLQDTWLFNGTVKENIAYGKPDATDDEIISAAKSALAHSFIEKLPYGYDTNLSSSGVSISSGQQQLLTIARVMLADPPMLILDEATSSVDTLTEIRIQTAFLRMMKGRTSFVIAHRLSTIREADMIVVMNQGQIVEIGNHEQLLNKKGYYYKLHESQFS